MTLAMAVGVDGGQRWAMTWVMMWAMMWAMGMMAATTPATMPTKGMVGTPAGRGGGLLVEDMAVAVAAAAAAVVTVVAAVAAYCWGCFLFIVKIFCVWYFYVWGELAR